MPGQSRWNVTNPTFGQIESILVQGANGSAPQLDDWGSAATASLAHANPSTISQISYDLMRDMPYSVVTHALSENNGSEYTLGELRKTRKLLLVARDGVQITAHDRPGENFDDFVGLCRTLGQVADIGADSVLTQSVLTQSILTTCEKLTSHPPSPSQASTDWEFQEFIAVMLKQVKADTADLTDADQFHIGRKRLRKIVHTTVINAVAQPSSELREIAYNGIALSQHFGRIKDELFRKAYATM